MSFLKITDPVKRDQIVKEYLETKKKKKRKKKKKIRDSQLAEKTGEIELQTDLSKFFKPITETQKESAAKIAEELKPIKEGIKQLPQAINLPNYPTIQAYTSEGQMETMGEKEWWKVEPAHYIGPIAKEYLTKFVGKKSNVDRTYGLYDKDGKFYIGDQLTWLNDDDIEVVGRFYKGTPGLWELIVAKDPNENIYTDKDLDEYRELMIRTNALYRNNDPKSKYPRAGKGPKWNRILGPVWGETREKIRTGDGIVVIPSDPNALLERLDLLMASKKAGNTGVRNELVSICDELKRQGVLKPRSYKNLMSIL